MKDLKNHGNSQGNKIPEIPPNVFRFNQSLLFVKKSNNRYKVSSSIK